MLYVNIAYLANAREQMDPKPDDWGFLPQQDHGDEPDDWGYLPTTPPDELDEDERVRRI